LEDNLIIFILSFVFLIYGFFSKVLENFNISAPMFFLLVGVLLSPLGFGLSNLKIDSDVVEIIAEVALIIVLFSDSSTLNLKRFKSGWQIPTRLLFIGLPLTIVFSTYVATLFFPNEALVNLLLMALILAPTDAALGKAVVTDDRVPQKIRSGINVESGLNDGIVFPMLMTVILLIMSNKGIGDDSGWVSYVLEQISLGFVFGTLSGFTGAKLLTFVHKKGLIEDTYKHLTPIFLAILSYYVADYFGGNGFISAFVSGMFFGNFTKEIDLTTKNFLESDGEILILISFLVFGLTFIPATYQYWDLKVLFYAVLSLTLFRMLPVWISLLGIKEKLFTKLFIGWFGPRGIASILYIMIVAHKIHSIDGHETLYSVLTLTILLSIVLHGLSAKPLVKIYSKYT